MRAKCRGQNDTYTPGSVLPISAAPRGVSGSNSVGLVPEQSPDRATAQRSPWSAPLGLLVDQAVSPVGGVGPTYATMPTTPKLEAPIKSGVAVNVRGAVIAHSPPPRELDPRPTLKGTAGAEPIRTIGFPVPGGLGKTAPGSVAHTAKAPSQGLPPPAAGRSWGRAGETPLPVPMRRHEIATMIAPKASGPLPAWAPGAGRRGEPAGNAEIPTRGMFGRSGGRR